MLNRNLDLLIVDVLALVAAAALVVSANTLALSAVALLFVFVLPGYALTAAVFATSGLGIPETIAASLGLSLALDIVGGLAIGLMPQGVNALSWAILLGGVTLVSSLIAIGRRPAQFQWAWHGMSLGLDLGQGLLLSLSVVVLVAGVMLARDRAGQSSSSFTQLWALPAPTVSAHAIQFGVRNLESSPMEYKLQVLAGGKLVYEQSPLDLLPGESWDKAIALQDTPNAALQVLLYRADNPTQVYREVTLSAN